MMRVRPLFRWYDLWVGLFVDRKNRRVYFFPIPCFGLVFEWGWRKQLKSYDPKNITVTMHGQVLKFEDGAAPGVRISNCVAGGDIVAINAKREP